MQNAYKARVPLTVSAGTAVYFLTALLRTRRTEK
jgi:hypothetical protein